MPKGDGTGPIGNGSMGRGRSNCQNISSARQGGILGATHVNSTKQGSLEEQAAQLEKQAANLRKLAKQ